ncbi:MAG: tetratricopeptide repeat protein [Kiritimatiellia bacterium]
MQIKNINSLLAVTTALLAFFRVTGAPAAREAKARRGEAGGAEYAAVKLIRKAEDLLEAGEKERGVTMLRTVVRQYPAAKARYDAYLALGRHYFEERDQKQAIDALRHLTRLKKADEELSGKEKDMYLEALYLTGVCHFQARQYGTAFSVLRKITGNYPNTVWANQAFYYIGLSHFAQEHWDKAIKAFSLVGTFVDPDSPVLQYAEAGHRLNVKVMDGDLPVLHRLGRRITVSARTKHGDEETITCGPLAGDSSIFLGSIPTKTARAVKNDGTLQITGGDEIEISYYDDNTREGKKDVLKKKKVEVVSSGHLTFTLGTFDSKATAAFLGQPLFVRLRDVDLDVSPGADTARIKVLSRYERKETEEGGSLRTAVDVEKLMAEESEEDKFETREEIQLVLTETGEGDGPVHTGIFTGSILVRNEADGSQSPAGKDSLACAVGDEIAASYIDEIHAEGKAARDVKVKIEVMGEIDSRPLASQDVVADTLIRSRKELVEAEAYLELARIFKSMGLKDGAAMKAAEGLGRLEFTLNTETPVPASLKQKAFRLKWELHLAQDNLSGAMATCKVFNQLYPDSPIVDSALMGIAKVYIEKGEYDEAEKVYRQVLGLPASFSKAEAQFRIAELAEMKAKQADERRSDNAKEKAVKEYKLCAKKYPDSEYAGRSLAKVVDYHLETKDYVVANDLLEQIFMDYQDEDFLDSMLLKWVLAAYRMGNFKKAHDKCAELIFQYPGSPHAQKAKQLLPRIEQKLGINNKG